MNTAEKLSAQEAARSLVYRRLADAFRLPGSHLPTVLSELETALACLGSDACANAAILKRSTTEDTAPCSLEVDFAGLFVGPFLVPAPPYGSVYLEDKRKLMGDSTVDVRQHYLSLGLDLSADFKEAPDHICAELEFMHVLISQGLEAIEAADDAQLLQSIRHQRLFLEKHLAAWIPAFTGKVTEHARTDYYRHLAALTQTFVAEEIETLPDLPVAGMEPVQAEA